MLQFTDAQLVDARNRWDIVAGDLPLKRQGREFRGLCPFHNEKSPSFYVAPDKGFFHCFGCAAHGDVIAYVMRQRNLEFVEAVQHILGLAQQKPARQPVKVEGPPPDEADDKTADELRTILEECQPITECTAAALYLHMRGIGRNPGTRGLFYHPGLECWELGRDEHGHVRKLPAIVAPITNSEDEITAILRTWLVDKLVYDGSRENPKDNRAPLRTRKKGLGKMGDGAVRLADPERTFGLAEGWETALSCSTLFPCPVWATCGTARFGFPGHWRERKPAQGAAPRMWFAPARPPEDVETVWLDERPPSIWLPPEARKVVIFGDNGSTGRIVAEHAMKYWRREGLLAFARFPAPQFSDFNDQLLKRVTA